MGSTNTRITLKEPSPAVPGHFVNARRLRPVERSDARTGRIVDNETDMGRHGHTVTNRRGWVEGVRVDGGFPVGNPKSWWARKELAPTSGTPVA
jgi:hypothetical protein